ncbi:3-hydroxyacyl-ACP dehydratase FabZ [Candidatus Bipolaricaulota bacterium]|nr:3-hydroxyacyl-ACP dehydratase FabZ [Candidatus Bipolaricaulota bacterium]
MDVEEIKNRIPLRYPYLLVDRVLAFEEGKLRALKNVTINEPFFQGHFPEPGPSVMPGTMIVEAMAQVSGILAGLTTGREGLGYLVGVDGARFRKKVTPGDQLVLEAELERSRGSICRVKVSAFVEEELASEAEVTLAFED